MKTCLVSEMNRWYFLLCTGCRCDIFKIIQYKIIFFYREIADLLADAHRMNSAKDLPVIETTGAVIIKTQSFTPVLNGSVQRKMTVASTEEDINAAILLKKWQQFHCAADMAVACGLNGVKDIHIVEGWVNECR